MKNKILESCRKLYNLNGLVKVTVRTVCKDLGISPGSFSYHYPDFSVIPEKLYDCLQKDIQKINESFLNSKPSITTYLEMHQQLFLIQLKYRFLYVHIIELINNNMYIKKAQKRQIIIDQKQAKAGVDYYMRIGILKPNIPKKAVDRMINVGQILHNFWLADQQLMPNKTKKETLFYYLQICCGVLEPYLSDNAKKEYDAFFAAQVN